MEKLTKTIGDRVGVICDELFKGRAFTMSSAMDYECEKYIVPEFKNADFLTRVQGDSMEPEFFSGDIVACEKVTMDKLWFQWGKTYVMRTY